MTRKRIFFLGVFLLVFLEGKAQLKTHFFAAPQFGIMYYLGDLKSNPWPEANTVHPFFGIYGKFRYENMFSVKFGINQGKVSAADSVNNPHLQRNFHFQSAITDIFVLGKFNLFNHKKVPRKKNQLIVTPGLIAGFGVFHFNPQVLHNGNWIDARLLGTEGQYIQEEGYPDPYSRLSFSLKLGGELNFRINDLVEVDLFTIYTKGYTDYLDDVSGVYPDSDALLATPNGELASEFTYRDKDDAKREAGSNRGNAEKKDGFITIGMSLNFRLTPLPKNRFNSRPTFRKRRRPAYF